MVEFKGHDILRRYKGVVSLLLGALAFAGIFWSIRLEYGSFNINFAFSLLLPMLVSLAWGWKYGLFSVTFGLVFLYPFILGSYNGWASLVPALSYFIWIGLHGFGSMKRLSDKRLWFNLYFLQLIHIVIKFLLYLTLFPVLIGGALLALLSSFRHLWSACVGFVLLCICETNLLPLGTIK